MTHLQDLTNQLITDEALLLRSLERHDDISVWKTLDDLEKLLRQLQKEDKLHEAHIAELEQFLWRLQQRLKSNESFWSQIHEREKIDVKKQIHHRIFAVCAFIGRLNTTVYNRHLEHQREFLKVDKPFAYLYYEAAVPREYERAISLAYDGMKSLIDELKIRFEIKIVDNYAVRCTEIIDSFLHQKPEMDAQQDAALIMDAMKHEDILQGRAPHFDMCICTRAFTNGWFGAHMGGLPIGIITIYRGNHPSYQRISDPNIFRVAKHEFGHSFIGGVECPGVCIMNHNLTKDTLCTQCKQYGIQYIEALEIETGRKIFR